MEEGRHRKRDTSYEWVTLRDTNIDYVAGITGIHKRELKQMLESHAEDGIYEVKLPLGMIIFTRKER